MKYVLSKFREIIQRYKHKGISMTNFLNPFWSSSYLEPLTKDTFDMVHGGQLQMAADVI